MGKTSCYSERGQDHLDIIYGSTVLSVDDPSKDDEMVVTFIVQALNEHAELVKALKDAYGRVPCAEQQCGYISKIIARAEEQGGK